MEVARDPSDQNLKLWFQYIETKNKLATRLQKRMRDYLVKNNSPSMPAFVAQAQKVKAKSITKIDPRQFRIRMYFESTCPHCKRMMSTLKSLQGQGYYVEAHQINKADSVKAVFPIATVMANPNDVKKYKINSVPFTIIANMRSKTVSTPIKGFHTSNEILQMIQLLKTKTNKGGSI